MLLMLSLLVSTCMAAIDLVAHAAAVDGSGLDISRGSVSAAMDSSKCAPNCLLAVCYAAAAAPDAFGPATFSPVSDSFNNSWVAVPGTRLQPSDGVLTWMFIANTATGPRVGPGHTITAAGYGAGFVGMAFTGVASGPDRSNSSFQHDCHLSRDCPPASSATRDAGPQPPPPLNVRLDVTPTAPGELLIPCFSHMGAAAELAPPFVTVANVPSAEQHGTGVLAGYQVFTELLIHPQLTCS